MIIKIKHKKEIFECLIDEEDFNLINDYNWYIHPRTGYTRGRKKNPECKYNFISMHRLILNIWDKKIEIDHRNHNKLDNRKENLRTCNRSQNTSNRTAYGISKYLGVSWHIRKNKWVAGIGFNKKTKYLGIFENEIDAAKAYDEAAKIYHGEFANLNFKEPCAE